MMLIVEQYKQILTNWYKILPHVVGSAAAAGGAAHPRKWYQGGVLRPASLVRVDIGTWTQVTVR